MISRDVRRSGDHLYVATHFGAGGLQLSATLGVTYADSSHIQSTSRLHHCPRRRYQNCVSVADQVTFVVIPNEMEVVECRSEHPDELVFAIRDTEATALPSLAISSLQFLERQHLQEWVLKQPAIIDSDVMVVTFEFDNWSTSSGVVTKDRLEMS